MILFLAGLVVFFGIHSVSIVALGWRNAMAARLGEWGWKGLYSVISLAGFLMMIHYAGFTDLMGRPKPTNLEWAARNASEATVLAGEIREGEAIYLWLDIAGEDEPRAYALPWSFDIARQLQETQRRAEQDGSSVRMQSPFEADFRAEDPMFYAEPQPAPPPKST